MDILDDMGVSKLSTKVFSKVNYSFKLSIFNEMLFCLPSIHLEKKNIQMYL